MKGLIRKDLYVLWGACKLQLAMAVLLAILSAVLDAKDENAFMFYVMSGFITAMLPMTLMAYDEQSRFDGFVRALPVSPSGIVLAKYGLTLLCTCGAIACYAAGKWVAGFFIKPAPSLSGSAGFSFMLAIMLLVPALSLPFSFRFGVEKGRFFFVLFGIFISAGASLLASFNGPAPGGFTPWLLPLGALALFVLSAPLSMRLYRARAR